MRVVLWLTLVSAAAAVRSHPAIGDALEWGSADQDYLGKRWQTVGVIAPFSSKRRTLDRKLGCFTGPNRRKGVVFWHKKRPWNPFSRSNRAPFKVRILSERPAGAMLTLAEEGKIELERTRDDRGRPALSVRMIKPSPWYRKFL